MRIFIASVILAYLLRLLLRVLIIVFVSKNVISKKQFFKQEIYTLNTPEYHLGMKSSPSAFNAIFIGYSSLF